MMINALYFIISAIIVKKK